MGESATRTVEIDVHHITRVEGHGNIVVRASDGTIEQVEWQVPEAPRFFEAMVLDQTWDHIQTIVSRICGICSVTHSLASLKAIEDAMGIPISDQTRRLRTLLHYGEFVESHVLHVGYLAAPDLLGKPSVVPLLETHPDLVKTIVRVHRFGNEIMDWLGGRRTHPVTVKPGGFSKLPRAAELLDFKQRFEDIVPDLVTIAETIASVADRFPDFQRETEYIGLVEEGEYPFYEGQIGSTDVDEIVPVQEFERVANEYVSPQSTAKWTKWHRDSYAVGALARFNLNADNLLPLAAKTAADLGLEKGCVNPYMNNAAQVVEVVQAVEDGLRIIEELLTEGIQPEKPEVEPTAGEGVGSVEAPRGILFHRYAFDESGSCVKANICIPTNQNHANIQKDFEQMVPSYLDQGEDELRFMMEMLVRSYDPCISCSTHYLEVEFV